MIQTVYAGLVAVVLVGQSSAFSSPTRQLRLASQHPSTAESSSSALYLSAADEEVQKLLAQAKKLKEEARRRREEVAVLSGKTVDEVKQEFQRKKELAQQREAIKEKAREEREAGGRIRNKVSILPVPDDAASQIQQAAAAVERAYKDGLVRQTVQFALLEEEEAMSGEMNEWPGGVQQMYRRSARPLAESLLREVRAYADIEQGEASPSNTPPSVAAEDIWDFDGSAILSAKAVGGSHGDVTAVVFPNTDTKYLKVIGSLVKDVGPDRLLLLINPFWKNAESWGFNILAPNGKKQAQEVIFDNGYDVTYAVLRFSARGEDVVALKAYPYEWQLYAYREDPAWFNQERPVWLGSSEEKPQLSQFSELLNARPEFKMSKNMRQMQRMMGNDDK